MQRQELIERFFSNQRALFKIWKSHYQELLGDSSLTSTQISTLFLIHQKRETNNSELAVESQTSRSAIAQQIDVLIQNDLVDRHEDPKDRRVIHIKLSEQGECLVHKLKKMQKQLLERTARTLTDEELQTAISINEKIIKELNN